MILKLIDTYEISTQEELLAALRENGVEATQATVSRDMKELGLVKIPGSGGKYRYSAESGSGDDRSKKYFAIFAQSVQLVDYSMNMVVLRCYSGMAQAACAALDAMKWSGIVGTLAGDDTVFVLCRGEQSAEKIKSSLEMLLNN